MAPKGGSKKATAAAPASKVARVEREADELGGRLLQAVTHGGRTYRPKNASDARAFAQVVGEEDGQLHPKQVQRLADKGVLEGFGSEATEAQKAKKAQDQQFADEDRAVREAMEAGEDLDRNAPEKE